MQAVDSLPKEWLRSLSERLRRRRASECHPEILLSLVHRLPFSARCPSSESWQVWMAVTRPMQRQLT